MTLWAAGGGRVLIHVSRVTHRQMGGGVKWPLPREICIGNSMVPSAIWKKHARVRVFQRRSKLHESEGRVQFDVFEKLTSVFFFKLHEKPYYYLLMIYLKKFKINYVFIC